MTLPVKALCDIEVKECVSCSDKILILDSDTDEARLACKDEIKGDKGDQGDPGTAATVSVGSTCTLAPGSSACVSNSGSSSAAVFNFGIPKGEKGEQGNPGASATVSVGSTTTLDAGCCASVTNTGTTSAAVLNFGIPKGAKGDPGQDGQDGNDGASVCAAAFNGNNIDFTDTCGCVTTLVDAKTCLKGDKGNDGEPGQDGQDGQDGNGITCVTATKSGKTTTVTMNYCTGDPTIFCVQDGADGQGSGDMSASTYDPTNKMADAFDYCNFYNTPTIPTDNCQLANGCGYTTCTGTVVAADLTPYALAANLCTVATSGKYCDLSGTPTIPTDNCQLANGCGYTTCTGTVVASDLTAYAKSCTLCTVATSGKYCDLTGTPTIPTDNCQLANGCGYTTCTGTITGICMNGCSCGTSGVVDLGTVTGDAKVFTISDLTSAASLATATEAYTYAYTTGKNAIIRYSGYNYVYALGGAGAASFVSVWGTGAVNSGNWATIRTLSLTVSSGSVTAILNLQNYINISSSAPTSATNSIITLVK